VGFDFDPGKDAINLGKHGFSLAAAAELSWEAALVWFDDRADYGEARMVALAPIGDILYFIARNLSGNEPDQLCTPSRPKHTAKPRFL
jgi:uncharacterized DUF497 family protein